MYALRLHRRLIGNRYVRQNLVSYIFGHRTFSYGGCLDTLLGQTAPLSILAQFEKINHSLLIEEETVRGYQAKNYYPVRLGDVFDNRYETIGKLGFGSASTVWLCRDYQKEHEFVVLKVYINNSKYHRELPIYEEIDNLRSNHEGRNYVRKMYHSFELEKPHGTHICLVHQPLGISLGELKELTPDGLFSADLARQTMRCILTGLQFLHEEVEVVHTGNPLETPWLNNSAYLNDTDLQPSNMLLGIHDDSVLVKFEQNEKDHPCPRKELSDRTIYISRPMPITKGEPSITDPSEARFGDQTHTDRIMPSVYRAPEVILGHPWGYSVDVWGFAMVVTCATAMAWHLFQPKPLFKPQDPEGRYSEAHHLAQMVALLGPPPTEFMQRCGDKTKKYWEMDGTWKNVVPIPDTSLDREDRRLEGEQKEQFTAFMRKALQWDPRDRHDAESLYWDEWLLGDLIESGEVVRED